MVALGWAAWSPVHSEEVGSHPLALFHHSKVSGACGYQTQERRCSTLPGAGLVGLP